MVTGDGRRASRRRWTVSLTAVVVAIATLSPLALPPPVDPGPPDVPLLIEESEARERTDLFSGRPAYLPEPEGPITTASPPAPIAADALVSKTIVWQDRHLPYLVPDEALPFRYHVERRLAERFGLDEVIAAMGQWDDVPGSRWTTEFVSVVDHPEYRPRPDGTSVVYLREGCPEHYLGGAFWNAAPSRAHVDLRYGAAAVLSPQIDIGICPPVEADRLAGVIAHEVGHAMGMAHLCEPGEVCWDPAMAEPERRCRAMYHRFGPCRDGITLADRDAARHLYPTLPRLYGPSRADTAARASYATTWTHRARTVVLARTDEGVRSATIGAALAGSLDAPLLLSDVSETACLQAPTADELARVAANPGRVLLVGDWPETCVDELRSWDLRPEEVGDPDAGDRYAVHAPGVLTSIAAADRIDEAHREHTGVGPDHAFVVPADDHPDLRMATAVVAASAGRNHHPLLITDPRFLSAPIDRWLAEHPTVRNVTVIGRPHQIAVEVVDRLWALGIVPERLLVRDPVRFATDLATREWPVFGATRPDHPVVLAPLGSLADTLVGASVAGRIDAPLLLAGVVEEDEVAQWLQRRRPTGGFLVGHPDRIPYELQWAYTTHVRPGDAVPSSAQRTGGRLFGSIEVP